MLGLFRGSNGEEVEIVYEVGIDMKLDDKYDKSLIPRGSRPGGQWEKLGDGKQAIRVDPSVAARRAEMANVGNMASASAIMLTATVLHELTHWACDGRGNSPGYSEDPTEHTVSWNKVLRVAIVYSDDRFSIEPGIDDLYQND